MAEFYDEAADGSLCGAAFVPQSEDLLILSDSGDICGASLSQGQLSRVAEHVIEFCGRGVFQSVLLLP